jgi:hypothetical protein
MDGKHGTWRLPPIRVLTSLLAMIIALAGSASQAVDLSGVPVFEQPQIMSEIAKVEAEIQQGRPATALSITDGLLRQMPNAPVLHMLRAAAFAQMENEAGAIAALEKAAALDFRDLAIMAQQPVFDGLRDHPTLLALVNRPVPEPVLTDPVSVREGYAAVAERNTRWDASLNMFRVSYYFPSVPSRDRGPIVARNAEGPGLAELAALHRRGVAAGHVGDLYDNRDNNHSRFNFSLFPQLGLVTYIDAARDLGIDKAVNHRILFNTTVIGNASTAFTTGSFARSLPRYAMTTPGVAARLAMQYQSNTLYVYPSHRDHIPDTGDRYPAVLPYLVASQGSSGSDRPLVHALALALGALRPDTKQRLRQEGLIAPTLQMLLRRSQLNDQSRYMQAAAHPSAFHGDWVDDARIVALANALDPDEIPPQAIFQVLEEPSWVPGLHIFGDALTERLFDTPSSVARIARANASTRRYVLDASATRDPNSRPLAFHWRVLRGDPDGVRIEALSEDAARVAVSIDWHERRPVPGRPDMTTDRVEIALFVDNGAEISAPAFFTVYFPSRQARRYTASGQIVSLDYAAQDRRSRYEDPALIPARDWRDEYEYDPDGHLLGWTRVSGDRRMSLTRHGAEVLERDAAGRPVRAVVLEYPVTQRSDGILTVAQRRSDEILYYAYDGPQDGLGYLDVPP